MENDFGDSDTQLESVKVYFLTSFIPRRDFFPGHLFPLLQHFMFMLGYRNLPQMRVMATFFS